MTKARPGATTKPAVVRSAGRGRTTWFVIPALLVVVLEFAWVHSKAFTIDDTLFLRQAEHVLIDPLHPTAFELVWSEIPKPTRMSAIMPSGPVMAYLLVPCVRAGGQEWLGHLVESLLFVVAVVATAVLARRLGGTPAVAGAAALIVSVTPTALAMTATCMPDVPAMAFGVLAVERLVAWRDDRRLDQLVAGVLSLALAVLARPQLALVGIVGALLLVVDSLSARRWGTVARTLWIPLGASATVVLIAVLITRDPQASSGALIGAALELSGFKNLLVNSVAFFTHWSLAIPFAIPWLALHPRRILRSPPLYVAIVATAAALLSQNQKLHLPLISVAAGIGFAALWDVVRDARQQRDATQLILGIWLFVAAPVTFYQHTPSKYLLASLPAAAILLARALEGVAPIPRKLALAGIAVYGLVLGGLIVRADAELADLGRTAARELVAPQTAAGRTVWLDGHWGFQWYAERAGGRVLTVTLPHPDPGDLAVSSLRTGGGVQALFPNRTLIKTIGGSQPGGRIISFKLGAGFYGTAWGYLPWWWGDDISDRFDLWQLD